MVAGDCRLQGERGFGKQGLQTKEKVVSKICEIASKVKGSIVNHNDSPTVMKSGEETRFIVNVKKGFVSVSFGTLVVWKGGLASFAVFQKSPPDDFMIDDTEQVTVTSNAENGKADGGDGETGGTEEEGVSVAQHFGSNQSLLPPFHVTKPPFFPPPMLSITTISAKDLVNGSVMNARPVNCYVRFKLGNQRYKTKVIKMSNNPIFDSESDNQCRLEVTTGEEFLVVQVFDWKPVKHRLLAQTDIPLSTFTSQGNGQGAKEIALPLRMRWKKNKTGQLALRVGYENVFLWWVNAEMEARDEVENERRRKEEAEKAEDNGEDGEDGEDVSGVGTPSGTAWYKFW